MNLIEGLLAALVAVVLFAAVVGLEAFLLWVGFVIFAPALGVTWLVLLAPVGFTTALGVAGKLFAKAISS